MATLYSYLTWIYNVFDWYPWFYFIPNMGMAASVRYLLFWRWHLLVPDPWAQFFGTSVKIGNVFQLSDALLTSHIRGHLL
jgi:hypothetical protein